VSGGDKAFSPQAALATEGAIRAGPKRMHASRQPRHAAGSPGSTMAHTGALVRQREKRVKSCVKIVSVIVLPAFASLFKRQKVH